MEFTRSHCKAVSQVVSSLMIIFLLLTALTTYTIFLSKGFNLASKTVERNQKEVFRSMENIIVKPVYGDNETEYILSYEGLRPTLKYVIVKCGNSISIDKPETYSLEFGKPIPEILLNKINEGCRVTLVSERGKVYDLSYQVSHLEVFNEKIAEISNVVNNVTEIAEKVNNVSQIMPFIGTTKITTAAGRIYIIGSEGNVLYELDIIGNLPIYDLDSHKTYSTPTSEFLGTYSNSLKLLGNEQVLSLKVMLNPTIIRKIKVYGGVDDGEIVLSKGIYLIYVTGDAIEGQTDHWGDIYGDGFKLSFSVLFSGKEVGWGMFDSADEKEFFFKGLCLKGKCEQFDKVYALIITEDKAKIKYYFLVSKSVTTGDYLGSFVIEKIADIGGGNKLRIVKHAGKFYLEYKGWLINLIIAGNGNVEGELYKLGSYIVAPIGYIVRSGEKEVASTGEPILVGEGEVELVWFKPVVASSVLDFLIFGSEIRYNYVTTQSSYRIYRQTYGNSFDQNVGLTLKVYQEFYEFAGSTYISFKALVPRNYDIQIKVLSFYSTNSDSTYLEVFRGSEKVFSIRNIQTGTYTVKIGTKNITYSTITIKLLPTYTYPKTWITIVLS